MWHLCSQPDWALCIWWLSPAAAGQLFAWPSTFLHRLLSTQLLLASL